jgi:hypothetical protein
LSSLMAFGILCKPVFRGSTFPWHLLIPTAECGHAGNKTNAQHSERRDEDGELDRKQGDGSDYKRRHGNVDREDLSARKRDRKWKEEWTGIRTGESRPRTRGVKGREKGGKGRFRLRGMGSGAKSRSRWKPRQNRQRRTSRQR